MMRSGVFRFLMAVMLGFCGVAAWAGAYEDVIAAIKRDDAAAVSKLLERGVAPDTVDEQGNTLLILAAREGSLASVRGLVAGKARIGAVNRVGEDALMHAAIQGHREIVRYLLVNGAEANRPGWSPLLYAAVKGDARIAWLLLSYGALVNAGAPNGLTALMMAAREGHDELVSFLLENKADPNLATDAGLTALAIARKGERAGIAAMLLKAGAK